MRWNKTESRPETYWKPWFAWHPVRLENTGEWVWLEWVWIHRDGFDAFGDICRYRDDVHWGGANLERTGSEWARK